MRLVPSAPPTDKVSATTIATAWQVLETLTDPEIPVISLRDLGVLRDVRESAEGMEVVITPTYSGCPAISQIEDDIEAALAQAGISARVVTQIAPPWTTDWISAAGRARLREYGIAPPGPAASIPDTTSPPGAEVKVLHFLTPSTVIVPCPQCASAHTTELSPFGSTACKALYRCLACQETFDYFKPY